MFGKLLYDEPKPLMMFAKFMGASTEVDDDGRITKYLPRGEVVINIAQIGAVYDHTLVIMGHKIRVVENLEEIKARLGAR